MQKLNGYRVATSVALVAAGLYTLYALMFAIFPDATFQFFRSWFHGLGVTSSGGIMHAEMSFGSYLLGLISVAIAAFISGGFFAITYNRLEMGASQTRADQVLRPRPN